MKDAKRHAKKRSLTGREVKDLNAFVKDKMRDCNMQRMSNFKDLSISSSNEIIQIIISNTSDEESDGNSCKPPTRSEVMGKNEQKIILRIIRI